VPPGESKPDVEQLIADAIRCLRAEAPSEGDAYWKAVQLLQQAEPERVWSRLTPFARAEPQHRRLVPDVLRFLGGRPQPLLEPTIELLGVMLAEPQTPDVLEAIAGAFVDLEHPSAVELLEPLTRHPEPEVRLAAVHGLLPVASLAIPTLIRLCEDEDAEVRNWATFALAARQGEPGAMGFDDSGVRDALERRLSDTEEVVRAEAALGLARRGDRRALPVVLSELERVPEWDHFVEAAELFADPVLLPPLERIQAMENPPFDVHTAILACRGAQR
jgi:HEAT repeat protein